MSNDQIDEWYELGRKNGAIGGKLVGRGRRRIPHVLHGRPLQAAARNGGAGSSQVRFRFDFEGTKVIL